MLCLCNEEVTSSKEGGRIIADMRGDSLMLSLAQIGMVSRGAVSLAMSPDNAFGAVCLSVCLPIYLSVCRCLSVYMSVCLSVCLSACLIYLYLSQMIHLEVHRTVEGFMNESTEQGD